MRVRAVSSTAMLLPVGGQWLIEAETTNVNGGLVDAALTVVVTLPDGSTTDPAVTHVSTGRYRVAYTVPAAGRYVAGAATADDVGYFAADVLAATTEAGMPTAGDVIEYMGPTSGIPEEVQSALDAETAAQRSVCRVRALYPADLREALLRRVARNLALRMLPLAVLQGDAEAGSSTVLPGRDPEVRRLEAPHRKLVVG